MLSYTLVDAAAQLVFQVYSIGLRSFKHYCMQYVQSSFWLIKQLPRYQSFDTLTSSSNRTRSLQIMFHDIFMYEK